MRENNHLTEPDAVFGRSFTDVAEWLLPLFSEPEGRDSKRFMFGVERPSAVGTGGKPFKISIGRRASPKS